MLHKGHFPEAWEGRPVAPSPKTLKISFGTGAFRTGKSSRAPARETQRFASGLEFFASDFQLEPAVFRRRELRLRIGKHGRDRLETGRIAPVEVGLREFAFQSRDQAAECLDPRRQLPEG